MTSLDWILVAILAAVYVATAVRAAMAAGRLGRSPIRWFAITICLSAIPAMIVFYRDARRRARELQTDRVPCPSPRGHDESGDTCPRGLGHGTKSSSPSTMIRCPNCRTLIDPSELAGMPVKTCPRCHLHIERVDLA